MDLLPFAVTWDYLCPFARNAHEHLVTALEGGAEWDVTFSPFCLMQAHVEEGEPAVWDQQPAVRGLAALQVGVVVRDKFPDRFLATHRALFAARHDQSGKLEDPDVINAVLESTGVPVDEVWKQIAEGWPLDAVRSAHEKSVAEHSVFGVPTFLADGQAVFVRVMTRPGDDAKVATATIERIMGLVSDNPEINEYKHTTIQR
jgi:hypothetical protein